MNRFKLWLNRNDFKILVMILIISMGYVLLNSMKSNDTRRDNQSSNTISRNVSLNENVTQNNITKEDFTQLDKSTEESQKVINVMQKLINILYQVNISSDNLSLRQDIYNMFSEDTIQDLINQGENVSEESILNFIISVDNISNYVIGNIYRCMENDNVVKYAVLLRNNRNERNPIDNYLVINIDYNQSTFSYSEIVSDLSQVNCSETLSAIENKGSNTF